MCALVASPRLCPQDGKTALDKAQQENSWESADTKAGKTEVAELLRTWKRG